MFYNHPTNKSVVLKKIDIPERIRTNKNRDIHYCIAYKDSKRWHKLDNDYDISKLTTVK